MFTLGKFGATIELDSSGFDTSMKNAEKRIKDTSKGLGGFAKGVAKVAGGIGVFKLIDKGFSMIKGSIDGAISRVDTLKQFPKVLQQMGYGADEAEKATKKLIDGIDGLPTTLNDITGTVQRMVNVFQDVDLATDSAVGLNNAFLASGASQDQASRGLDQYIKMLSTGKVNMQSWQTLQETMPYALQQTAEAFKFTGKTAQNDFYEALKSGDITMDEFNSKIIELSDTQGGFADVAIDATKGISTSWGNIQTAITNGVAKSIQAFDDWFESKGMGGISGILDNIKLAVGQAFNTVNQYIPTALDWFGKLFEKIQNSTAFNTLRTVIENTIEAVQNLWNKFGETSVLDTAKEILTNIGEALLNIDFVKVVDDILNFLDNWSPLIAGVTAGILAFKLITGAIALWSTVTTIATGVGTAFGTVMAFITSPIGIVVLAIGLLVAAGVLLYKNWDTVKEKTLKVWNSITDFFVKTFDKIMKLFGKVLDWIDTKTGGKFKIITDTIRNYLNMGKEIIVSVLDYWKNTFKNVLAFLKALVTGDFQGMKNAIQNQLNNSLNLVRNILGSMKTFFSSTVGNILSNVKSKFVAVKNAIFKPVDEAKNKVKSIINTIKGFFTGLSLKIPSIKLPKLPKPKITGSFSLTPPSVPKISWNAKGGVFNSPTVFDTNKGLQGVGEAGAEAIIPLSSGVLAGIGKGISNNMQGGSNIDNGLLKEQNRLLKQLVDKNTDVVLDSKVITKSVSNRQGDRYNIDSFTSGNR